VIITELWREALGAYNDLLLHDADMVVGEVNVRFLGPARFDDELLCEAWLERVGETSIITRIDLSTSGSPVVEGRIRHVFIQPDTKQKRAMPDHVRDALTPYLKA
jgi:acyl-CoA thioester hydrolase